MATTVPDEHRRQENRRDEKNDTKHGDDVTTGAIHVVVVVMGSVDRWSFYTMKQQAICEAIKLLSCDQPCA